MTTDMLSQPPRLLAAALFCSFAFTMGCNDAPPTGTVSGDVLLEGEPYGDASLVLLSPQTGQGASTDIQSDGSFAIEDPLPVGAYTAYLAPKFDPNVTEPQPVRIDESVNEKYWNEAASDLSVEVAEGENDVTLELTR